MINSIEVYRTAIAAALEAGQAILEIYHRDFDIEYKEDESPLTQADKKANEIISKKLSKTQLPILSEEGRSILFEERKNWKKFWMVDPLDGTKEFIKKNDEFTVNIALIKGQYPSMGVIYVPVLDILYYGLESIGSYKLESARVTIDHKDSLDDIIKKSVALPLPATSRNFTIVASRSHMSNETEKYIKKLVKEKGKPNLISRGSSLKLCMIAEGHADIYPRFAPTSEWDTAAGQAIVECSGGSVTRIDEKETIKYNKKDLLNPWFIAKRE